MSEFDAFWSAYPRKVGKLAAMNAYVKARRLASAAEILAGVENYKRHLPEDVRFIPHASTFLNQGRWMDEYEEPQQPASFDWFGECQRLHQGKCGGQFRHHLTMQTEQQQKRESA